MASNPFPRTRGPFASVFIAAALTAHCATTQPSGPSAEESAEAGFDAPGLGSVEGGFQPDGTPEVSAPSGLGCSGDLQQVIDASGKLVKSCAPDLGCFGGECIPACEAAAKSKGSVGCEFLVSTPSFFFAPPCLAVFVANNWPKPLKIEVSRGESKLDVTKFARIPNGGKNATTWPRLTEKGLPPNQVAVMFMSSDPSSENFGFPLKCPVEQAVAGGTAVSGTGRGTAFRITTDAPASAYDILPFGGATSFLPGAQLLLPTSAWGKNYVAVLPRNAKFVLGNTPQWAHVIAKEEGTTLTIAPTVSLPSGAGVSAAAAGATSTFVLKAGEYIQWHALITSNMEMSGSVLESDKPVAFIGGSDYLCLDSIVSVFGGGCDSQHQEIPPVAALASEYVAAPYATRLEDLGPERIHYRLVGTVDGTKLDFDPKVPGPTTLGRGTVLDIEAAGPFVVSSQDKGHPFYLGQEMSGGPPGPKSGALPSGRSRVGSTAPPPFDSTGLGDEDFINVLPPAQFLRKYVFFNDPTYGTTTLTLTRVRTPSGFKDVTVDCLGVVSGWTSVGSSGAYETVAVDIARVAAVGSCVNGQHTAFSDGPFGLVVWGIDGAASYGYPAGGNVSTINSVVVPALPK